MDSDAQSDSAVTVSLYASSVCDVCSAAAARASETGDVVECVCGALHGADVTRVMRRPDVAPRPGLDVRPGEVQAPRLRPVARRTGEDRDGGLRALLCDLRPDRSGPFGWGIAAEPPSTEEPTLGALAARIRVQCTDEVPAILPGAFASAATVGRGALIARLLERTVGRLDDEASRATGDDVARVRAALRGARALVWLQRHGTLVHGAEVLYRLLAQALADEARRNRWREGGAGAARGAALWGAERSTEALVVWAGLAAQREAIR